MVLAVDAGHQMKNKVIYMLYHHWRNHICRITSLGMATFIQGDYGAVQTKGNILQFGEYKTTDEQVQTRASKNLHSIRPNTTSKQNGLWFVDEGALLHYCRCVPRAEAHQIF